MGGRWAPDRGASTTTATRAMLVVRWKRWGVGVEAREALLRREMPRKTMMDSSSYDEGDDDEDEDGHRRGGAEVDEGRRSDRPTMKMLWRSMTSLTRWSWPMAKIVEAARARKKAAASEGREETAQTGAGLLVDEDEQDARGRG